LTCCASNRYGGEGNRLIVRRANQLSAARPVGRPLAVQFIDASSAKVWHSWLMSAAVRLLLRLSTAGAEFRSTVSRPVETYCNRKHRVSVAFPVSGRTITSSTSRRIRTGTAGSEGAEFPSNSRKLRWGRRHDSSLGEGSRVEPAGYQPVTSKIHVFLQKDTS
jgi:hypothetical protein